MALILTTFPLSKAVESRGVGCRQELLGVLAGGILTVSALAVVISGAAGVEEASIN